ncbi:extracellular solute-binding protein [Amycolatopsis rhabdoformis]|uniref:Extracellular solute-binding protein n=1 Tax=Amycolatopsis rhabdoformis TaxID=1448059 RepID=A0ABZ1IHD2_9PSEU|nr:extracellular solute-binding protein [Amycolatopsis rhabdoformis]WSE33652.1 extracellular solute-binding protein [Amycolatopsis rhabdoformis]
MHKRRSTRRTVSAVLASGLALTMAAACGPGATDSSGAAQATADKRDTQQLAVEAAKEGQVVWYTTFADTDVAPIIASFNKAYPKIKVNALRLSADKIPPRVITEQRGGKYNADVVSGDSPQIAQLLQAGALQPYHPVDAAPLPAGLTLPDGYQGVVYAVTTVLSWNPQVLKQKNLTAPTSWEDLTKPQWRGQFSIDPGAVNWYDSLITAMGHDKALALLKGLGDNAPVFVESHTQALTNVQAGEPLAAATAYGYKASSLKEKTPNTLDYVNGTPLPASLNLIDVVKNSPHPNAARLFDDWMVSKAGQQEIADVTNHTSVRPDVTNDPNVWDEKKWPAAWGHPNLSQTDYNNYLSEMKSALKAP